MSKNWNYIKDKIPDQEKDGQLFEVSLITDTGNLAVGIYKVEEGRLMCLEGGFIPLISKWFTVFTLEKSLEDKWRYISKNEYMAYL